MTSIAKKYPSFKAQHGRAPIPGKDYDPNGFIEQDDYEYYTGTGRYSDDVEVPGQMYYLWNELNGERRHGMKPVTLERARVKMIECNQRNDGRVYWFEPVPEEELHNYAWLRELHPDECNCVGDWHCDICDAKAAEVWPL